jgi:hypothetical protein
MTNQSQRDLKQFMAVAQQLAIRDAERMPTTPDVERRANALVAHAREQFARTQREALAKRPSNIVSGAIRAAIRALSPMQLRARLAERCAQHPELVFAHRDYEHLPEDDLRSALEDIESILEQRG